MQGFAGKVLLGNLTFEFDTMGSVLGHGLHPVKARLHGQLRKPILSGQRGPLQHGALFHA